MRDLKGSSALEQDTDVIGMLWRPLDDEGNPTKADELILAKNRDGHAETIIPVRFMGQYLSFAERESRAA